MKETHATQTDIVAEVVNGRPDSDIGSNFPFRCMGSHRPPVVQAGSSSPLGVAQLYVKLALTLTKARVFSSTSILDTLVTEQPLPSICTWHETQTFIDAG